MKLISIFRYRLLNKYSQSKLTLNNSFQALNIQVFKDTIKL